MERHYQRMVRDTEKRVSRSLRMQIQSGPEQGGFRDPNGLVQAKFTIYQTTTAIAAYCNPDCAYFHDKAVLSLILSALDYTASKQHEDGLFDLISCNFHSAPDTAFCLKRMLPCYRYLLREAASKEEGEIRLRMESILRRGAEGLTKGGFHTPNHRWAIASILMECSKLFGDKNLADCAALYLNEGIDCNKDGEFAEKSAGNYNRINNDAMISLGDSTGEESYYEYAVRNLRMMMSYIEPDGSIFTANSTRQDRGKTIYPKDYYIQYLDMGLRRGIPEFLDMANTIFDMIEQKGLTAPDMLIRLMERPQLRKAEHEGRVEHWDFNCFYRESSIARIRKDSLSMTLMAGKSGFLNVSNETIHMEMKLGISFCEHRAFQAEEIQREGDGFCLSQVMRGWYYLPFRKKPDTADWWKMEHSQREKLLGPDLAIKVRAIPVPDGMDVYICAQGVPGAPMRVEMAVSGASLLSGGSFALPATAGGTMVLKEGKAVFTNESDHLEIGPGFGNHLFIAGKFGSEERSPYAFTLYFTDYSEFEHVIQIRTGKRTEA